MKAQIEDFKTGWYGLSIGVKKEEIKELIKALKKLENHQDHFHLRSTMEGDRGIADIEFFLQENAEENNLELDLSKPIYPE